MSGPRLFISIFLIGHLTATAVASLPDPVTLRARAERPQPPDDNLFTTRPLNRLATTLSLADSTLWDLIGPLRKVSRLYVRITGLDQTWSMFSDPPLEKRYLRLHSYVASAEGAVWMARELVYPAGREDRPKLVGAYRDSYQDKACEVALLQFFRDRKANALGPDTRPSELPDDLAPLVRYFGT